MKLSLNPIVLLHQVIALTTDDTDKHGSLYSPPEWLGSSCA